MLLKTLPMKLLLGLLSALLSALLPALALPAQGPAHLTQIVQQAEPPVQWPAPAAIGYGTALDATQLNASSTVPGTFDYTPAAGTVLAAGQQTLSVVFTPSDLNYKSATVQVPFTVRPAVGATFDFSLWHPPTGEIVWRPGDTITLWITPVGDFHQPIALSCTSTAGYKCSLDQTVMRPVDVALPLRLTVSRINSTQGETPSPTGTILPAMLLLIFVCGARKKLRGAGVLAVLLIGIVGCGSRRTATVTVTGTSLRQTKSIVIHVVDTR